MNGANFSPKPITILLVILLLAAGCTEPAATPRPATPLPAEDNEAGSPTAAAPLPPPANQAALIQPAALVYQGGFRLPEESGGSNWEYSGYALTYYPGGDPAGGDDGFPGSLFAVGHDHQQYVSEISIPAPVVSTNQNPAELPTAATLQPFADITGGLYDYLEIPRAGLAYLPDDAGQEWLYFAWGQHFEFERTPTHGRSSLDLASPQTAGLWFVGDYTNYILNDYLFDIPAEWAAQNAPGMQLATGRFRDGVWSGLGPALLAVNPDSAGAAPAANARLEAVPLLLYGSPAGDNPEISISEGQRMTGFSEADEWSGGAWLTAGDQSAVIFAGTKALGQSWYGFANGVVYPTSGDPDEVVPEVPPWPFDDRGWWSEAIAAQILFYNPDDLAAVARGEMESWEPQPYAVLDINDYLFDPGFNYERQKRYLLGAIAFDRTNGYLYIVERRADEDKSLIHVFSIE